MVRTPWEVTMNDRNADPPPRPSPQRSTPDGPQPDATDYGQPAGSPGGRGGTTCYGGIRRVAPRNAAKDTPPTET
ncbi:hypothetical protein [Azospirillum doebereinerae]